MAQRSKKVADAMEGDDDAMEGVEAAPANRVGVAGSRPGGRHLREVPFSYGQHTTAQPAGGRVHTASPTGAAAYAMLDEACWPQDTDFTLPVSEEAARRQRSQDAKQCIQSYFWQMQQLIGKAQDERPHLSREDKESVQELSASLLDAMQEFSLDLGQEEDAPQHDEPVFVCQICRLKTTNNSNHICGNKQMSSGCGVKLQVSKAYGQHIRQFLRKGLAWEVFWHNVQESAAPREFRSPQARDKFKAELRRAAEYLFCTHSRA